MGVERIASVFRARGARPLVIPYLTAGFPSREETVDLLLALEAGGADLIELGLPFSDPLADGPVIQQTSQRALDAGITHRDIVELVRAFRMRSGTPLVLMGYVNPILAFGPARFFAMAADAGADGIIVPDLPVDEAALFREDLRAADLAAIHLAAPTSSPERLRRVDAESTVFTYCVAVTGVTGARDRLPDGMTAYLERARGILTKPFVVGFGIGRAEHVRQVVPPAAGVVVGSALLRALLGESSPAGRAETAAAFLRGLREAGPEDARTPAR